LTEKPIGVGLEPPAWLRRLDDEVQIVRHQRANGAPPSKRGLAAGVSLPFAELQRQLDDWERGL